MPEPIKGLAPSPDGRWIALSGVDHLMLFDRTQPQTAPHVVTNGVTKDMDWSGDGKYLAGLVDESALAVRIDPGPMIVNRRYVGERRYVASASERVYSIGVTGVALIPWENQGSRKPLVGDPINIVESRGGVYVAASQGGIAVLADSGDLTLIIPAGRVDILDASAHSPYVVATVEERLVVWNLDEVQAQRIDVEFPIERAAFVGNTAVLAAHASGPMTWVDLVTGKAISLDKRASLLDVAGAPDGALACAVDVGRAATLFAPGKPAVALEGTVSHAAFVSNTAHARRRTPPRAALRHREQGVRAARRAQGCQARELRVDARGARVGGGRILRRHAVAQEPRHEQGRDVGAADQGHERPARARRRHRDVRRGSRAARVAARRLDRRARGAADRRSRPASRVPARRSRSRTRARHISSSSTRATR
jgi:hypothetical protein